MADPLHLTNEVLLARMEALAAAGRIEMVVPFPLARLEGVEGRLNAVVVADLDGLERRIEADRLLPFFGLAMELGPIAGWGLALGCSLVPFAIGQALRSRRPRRPAEAA